MGKIEIVDNCLAPEKDIFLNYKGANPWGVWKAIHGGIRPFFHISAVGMSNYDFKWDRSSPDFIEFFSKWWIKKNFSNHSTMRVDVKVQGKQFKSTNEGNFSVRITSDIVTNFEGWSVFLKPLWYMYSYLFYDKVRRRFIDRCREYSEGFKNELKEQFGLESTTFGPKTISSK